MKFLKEKLTLSTKITLWSMFIQVILALVSLIFLLQTTQNPDLVHLKWPSLVALIWFVLATLVLVLLIKNKIKEKYLLFFAFLFLHIGNVMIYRLIHNNFILFLIPIVFSTASLKRKNVLFEIAFSLIAFLLAFLIEIKNYSDIGKACIDILIPQIAFILVIGFCAVFVANENKIYSSENVAKQIQYTGSPTQYPFEENRDDIDIFGMLKGDEFARGDFFDYFFVDDHHLLFYVAELSIDGIESSMLLNGIRSAIKEISLVNNDLVEIVKQANEKLIKENKVGALASIFIGVLNTYTGKVRCLNAGEVAPFIKKANGEIEQINIRKNVMLGYSKDVTFKGNEIFIEEGDMIFAFTKGLMNTNKKLTSRKENNILKNNIKNIQFVNAKSFVENVFEAQFDNSHLNDDAIGLAIKFKKKRSIYFETVITSEKQYDKFGGVILDNYSQEFIKAGFEYADYAKVECNGHEKIVAIVPDYRYLKAGGTGVLCWPDQERKVIICTFGGSFIKSMGINEKTKYPIKIGFYLHERKGYYATFITHDLHRTNVREDYPHLTDEQYCNFRMVSTTNIAKEKLYRGCSPVNPRMNRNQYADQSLKNHNIKTIINLECSLETCKTFPNFENTYYSKQNIKILNVDANYETPKTRQDIANIMRAILSSENETPIYMHCFEGQDRTGLIIGIIEAFMGAPFKEVLSDFMTTYYNYYGVEKGNIRYAGMSMNLISELEECFETDDLYTSNLKELAWKYMSKIGLSEEEKVQLYERLNK